MLVGILESQLIPIGLVGAAFYRNRNNLALMKAFTSREEAKKSLWAILEIGGTAIGYFVVYPFVVMPAIVKSYEYASSCLACVNLPALSLSGLKHNILSANIVNAAAGVANAYYLNYEMWDRVEKEVKKDPKEYNKGLRDKLVQTFKEAEEAAEDKDKQAIRDKLSVRQKELEERIKYADEKRKFFNDHPYILPCLKYATAGSIGVLSLFVESKAYNPLFAVMPAASYLATSAITHYITSQPGEPLAVKMVTVPMAITKQVFEISGELLKAGVDYAGSFVK